jgi:hypothetical protein
MIAQVVADTLFWAIQALVEDGRVVKLAFSPILENHGRHARYLVDMESNGAAR